MSDELYAVSVATESGTFLLGSREIKSMRDVVAGNRYVVRVKADSIVEIFDATNEWVDVVFHSDGLKIYHNDTYLIYGRNLPTGDYVISLPKTLFIRGEHSSIWGFDSNHEIFFLTNVDTCTSYYAMAVATSPTTLMVGGGEFKVDNCVAGSNYIVDVSWDKIDVLYECKPDMVDTLFIRDSKTLVHDHTLTSIPAIHEMGLYYLNIPSALLEKDGFILGLSPHGVPYTYRKVECIDFDSSYPKHFVAVGYSLDTHKVMVNKHIINTERKVQPHTYLMVEVLNGEVALYSIIIGRNITDVYMYRDGFLKNDKCSIFGLKMKHNRECVVSLHECLYNTGYPVLGLLPNGEEISYVDNTYLAIAEATSEHTLMVEGKERHISDDLVVGDFYTVRGLQERYHISGEMKESFYISDGVNLISETNAIIGISNLSVGVYRVSVPSDLLQEGVLISGLDAQGNTFAHERVKGDTFPRLFVAIGYSVNINTMIVSQNVMHTESRLQPHKYYVVQVEDNIITSQEIIKDIQAVSDGYLRFLDIDSIFNARTNFTTKFDIQPYGLLSNRGLPICMLLPSGKEFRK